MEPAPKPPLAPRADTPPADNELGAPSPTLEGAPYEEPAVAVVGLTVDSSDRPIVTGSTVDLKLDHDVFATVRYNEDGSLDTTFGKKGKVLTAINTGKGDEYFDYAADVVIDADGKILVAGSTSDDEASESAVVRYNEAIAQFPAALLAWLFGFQPARGLRARV